MFATVKGLFVTWNEWFNLVFDKESIKKMFRILRFIVSAIPVKRAMRRKLLTSKYFPSQFVALWQILIAP